MVGAISNGLAWAGLVLFASMPAYAAHDAPQVHLPPAPPDVTDSISSPLSDLSRSIFVAQAEDLQGADSIVEVSLPAVENYWLTAVRTAEGRVVLDGYLPSESVRADLAADSAVDSASIELAGGEPEDFEVALAFGLEQLSRMSEGRFSLRSTVMTLTGTAATEEDLAGLTEPAVPQGFVLARNEILPAPEASAETGASQESSTIPVGDSATEPAVPDEAAASNSTDTPAAPAISEPVTPDAAAETPPSPVADPYVWSAGKDADGIVTLSGHIPAEPLRRILMLRAGGGAVDTTQFASGAPEGFILDTRAAMDVLALFSQGTVAFDGTNWSASGTLTEAADEAAVKTALAEAATPATEWSLDLADSAPAAPSAESEPAASAAALAEAPLPGASAEADACRTDLAAFSEGNPILFRSGSAAIAVSSQPALADLAATVSACPDLPIYIEGHTDADGAADANLALSVARAEAVVAALVALSVEPSRLYAIGYGESAPIASNETAQGKQQNRRIVISLDPPED